MVNDMHGFAKTPREFILESVDVPVIHLKTEMYIQQLKNSGMSQDGMNKVIIEYVAEGHWGWRMHIPLAETFGYELQEEDKENLNKAIQIREIIDEYAQQCAAVLKSITGLSGAYYFSENDSDGSYCLYYQESTK